MNLKSLFLLAALLQTCCLLGQTRSEYEQALIYCSDENYTKSFESFLRLASFEEPNSESSLAMHYQYGLGTPKNENTAALYYQRSADKGDENAQEFLVEYFLEQGSNNKVLKYSRMFSTNPDVSLVSGGTDIAYYTMYECYINGWGVEKNEQLALIWLSYAAWKESDLAIEKLEELYKVDLFHINDKEADKWIFNKWYDSAISFCGELINFNDISDTELNFFKMYHAGLNGDYLTLYETVINLLTKCKIDKILRRECLEIIVNLCSLFDNNEAFELYYRELTDYEVFLKEEVRYTYNLLFAKIMLKIEGCLSTEPLSGTYTGNEWVNLGLPSGTKWSTYNMGSNSIFIFGDLYAWGENKPTKGKNHPYSCTYDIFNMGSKDPSLLYGNGWSTPSIYDWMELFEYCNTYITDNPTLIHFVGPNKQEIVLPINNRFTYWCNSKIWVGFDDVDKIKACCVRLDNGEMGFFSAPVYSLGYIRPIIRL
ncbi:MAG: tetratricopeptide repeat protein [Candidatus Cryptobacteroides sp.]